MLDLTSISATPPSKAVASTPNGGPPGDFSRVLAKADDPSSAEPDSAAAQIASKSDDADRQDIAADGKDSPQQDDQTIDPALINLLFLAPVPIAAPVPDQATGVQGTADQNAAIGLASVATATPVLPLVDPQAATATTDTGTSATALPAANTGDEALSPELLKAFAAAKAKANADIDPAPPTNGTTGATTTPATAAPAKPDVPIIILPAAGSAVAPVIANLVSGSTPIAVPPSRGSKTDQPSGQRAAIVAPTLAGLTTGLVDGPVIGVVQPAARAFASAIAATTAGLQRDPRDSAEDSATAIFAPALGTATHELAAAPREATTLDTRGAQWREALVDHIETLRDAADARDTRIRLVPDALGRVDVAIRKDGDTVNVRFTTETPAARQLLVDARPQLAALAEARGLKIGQTSVDSGTQGSPQQGAHQGNTQQRASDQPIQNRRPVRSDATTTTEPADSDGWIA